mmetsp:Transcript_54/g.50  ORF Transcript_54/g.50 Transcript_54/m.50 type:complete len:101 (+) Transcript_54:430-732(+)
MDRNKLSIFHLPEHNKLMIEGTIEYMVDSKKEGTSTLMGSVNSEYMWMQTIDVSEMDVMEPEEASFMLILDHPQQIYDLEFTDLNEKSTIRISSINTSFK